MQHIHSLAVQVLVELASRKQVAAAEASDQAGASEGQAACIAGPGREEDSPESTADAEGQHEDRKDVALLHGLGSCLGSALALGSLVERNQCLPEGIGRFSIGFVGKVADRCLPAVENRRNPGLAEASVPKVRDE